MFLSSKREYQANLTFLPSKREHRKNSISLVARTDSLHPPEINF